MPYRDGRSNIKGTTASRKSFKRMPYAYDEKQRALQAHRDGWTLADIGNQILGGKPARAVSQLLFKWRKKTDLIEKMASNVRTQKFERFRERATGLALSPAAQTAIVDWINSLRADGIPVSSTMLRLKALEVGETDGVRQGLFSASPSWINSFLSRHELSFRTRNRAGQAEPDDDTTIGQRIASEVRSWMAEHRTTRVYNADQTGVFFEMLPKRTVSARGIQTVWVKCAKKEKERATAMLLADSDGNKYPPFLVFRNKGSTIPEVQAENVRYRHRFSEGMWMEIEDIQAATGAQVYGSPQAWWNASLSVAWLDFCFGDRTPASPPILLLLDAFSGHWTDEVQTRAAIYNVKLKAIPPCLTWRCQPADVAWMKPIKDALRRRWVEHLQEQLARHKDGQSTFKMRSPDRVDITEWVAKAWNDLSDVTIIQGFSKCGFRDRPDVPQRVEATRDELDATALISAMATVGLLDSRVGEVEDCHDILLPLTEAVVQMLQMLMRGLSKYTKDFAFASLRTATRFNPITN